MSSWAALYSYIHNLHFGVGGREVCTETDQPVMVRYLVEYNLYFFHLFYASWCGTRSTVDTEWLQWWVKWWGWWCPEPKQPLHHQWGLHHLLHHHLFLYHLQRKPMSPTCIYIYTANQICIPKIYEYLAMPPWRSKAVIVKIWIPVYWDASSTWSKVPMCTCVHNMT